MTMEFPAFRELRGALASGRGARPLFRWAKRPGAGTRFVAKLGAVCRWLPAIAFAVSGLAHAQAWPSKPVRIVVPVGAGGTTDLLARVVGDALSKSTGQPFIIDLKPGAAGAVGSIEVARAPADGYTLLVGTSSTHGVAPAVSTTLRYSMEEFTPVALLAEANTVLLVSHKLGVKNIKELLALGREKPGFLNYTSTGNGTFTHMVFELFGIQSGVSMTHIPYKGAGQMMPDLMSGTVHMVVDALPSGLPHVKGGRALGLAVTGPRRSSQAPDIPTLAESGLPGFSAVSWFGVYGPRGMPPELTRRINEEINKVLNSPEMVARFEGFGVEPGRGSAADFGAMTAADIERWRRIARQANVKVD